MKKIKVLMMGPSRKVKGGMTTVVDSYYSAGLDKKIKLKYIETINDGNKLSKILKMLSGFIFFMISIPFYNVVHIHMASRMSAYRKGIYVRIAHILKKRVILHSHGAEYKVFYNEEIDDIKRKYVKNTLKYADIVIVLSEEWKDFFKTIVSEDKIKVLYNAIIVPENFPKKLTNNQILFLGRIGKRKGIYDLVDTIEEIIPQYPNVKLFVGGDGEVEKFLNIIKEKNLEKNIEYIGWTSGEKKEKYLRQVSFYILPSYNEGMPMSVLEGMAYKNVTISTNVGGTPKIINNGKNGILIEPGDRRELKDKLLELIKDRQKRELLSSNAYDTINKKFNINKNIDKLIQIYME